MIVIGLLILLFFIIILFLPNLNHNNPTALKDSNEHFCILIPARDESKVIEELLQSIQNQTRKIPMEDVYVIVENELDPTVAICKQYNVSVFVRKNLSLRRKGYALNECLEQIYTKNYDAYFIFDADNILDKDFIKNMIPIYRQGYDIGIGYRNIKNGNNVISGASALTFSIINTLSNTMKTTDTRNVTLSGTGFFINGKWIHKWKGFPFHELTEDYELYLYSITQNMTSYYNTKSIFYDEQPTTFKQSFTQRQRWIKGYFNSRKKYRQKLMKSIQKNDPNIASKLLEIIGLLPIVILIFIALSPMLLHIYKIFSQNYNPIFLLIDGLFIYSILLMITLYIFKEEKNNLDINPKIKWKVILYHPIFLISYVPCFFSVIFKKEVEWKKIEHTEKYQKRS